jgi:hypothetical protein
MVVMMMYCIVAYGQAIQQMSEERDIRGVRAVGKVTTEVEMKTEKPEAGKRKDYTTEKGELTTITTRKERLKGGSF